MTIARSRTPPPRKLRSLAALETAETFATRLRVSDVLGFPGFRQSRVVAGRGGLHRPLQQVNVMQVPTDRYAKPDELLLAAATAFQGVDGDAAQLVRALADRGVAALAVRGGSLSELLGQGALRVAEERRLPMIELPAAVHLNELEMEVLETMVAAHAKQLKVAAAVRDGLADLALAGSGLSSLPQAIAEMVGGDVAVFAADAGLLAASEGADMPRARDAAVRWLAEDRSDPVEVERDWVVWPVVAGTRRLGCLVARIGGRYDAVHLAGVQHGAVYAALQMLHRQEAAETWARFRAGFVRDLLSGSLASASARRRAAAVGWQPNRKFVVLLASRGHGAARSVIDEAQSVAPEAMMAEHSGACLAVVPCDAEDQESGRGETSLPDFLAEHLTTLCEEVHVGLSAQHTGMQDLPMALAQAEEALQVARRFDRRTRVRRFEEMGLFRLLAQVPTEDLLRFRREVLGPLDALAQGYRASLVVTLELLIESGLNVAETARRGGWHYNTVRSRVARLTELLGPFMEDGVNLDSISVALVMERELADPPAPRQPTA